MKNLKIITIITLLFCVMVFMFTILDFLALHDIKQDYVSQHILNKLEISLNKDLPSWTSTEGEWQTVLFSLYSRFLFFILNIALLVFYYIKVVTKKQHLQLNRHCALMLFHSLTWLQHSFRFCRSCTLFYFFKKLTSVAPLAPQTCFQLAFGSTDFSS